ncbi:unnamed protein product [Albugo candida]|uniref:Uncharacterized protein n=1 Tax=Albugo candida TaxID=65357 RepID=A0A024GQ88_9STRA|nr:unnamed protein product [Albugo candida]|eukprot:CCI48731.1 unnamed protein product [Albugo candida]
MSLSWMPLCASSHQSLLFLWIKILAPHQSLTHIICYRTMITSLYQSICQLIATIEVTQLMLLVFSEPLTRPPSSASQSTHWRLFVYFKGTKSVNKYMKGCTPLLTFCMAHMLSILWNISISIFAEYNLAISL